MGTKTIFKRDILEFLNYFGPSKPNLKDKLQTAEKTFCRSNETLELELAKTSDQRDWHFELMESCELKCQVLDDLINNFDAWN